MMGLKNLFWADDGAPPGEGTETPTDAPAADAATVAATVVPDGAAPSAILTADFATIYGVIGVGGHPVTDNLLTAFGELEGADDKSKRLAMNVAIKAAGIDVAAVVDTLAKRAAALDAAVRAESGKVDQRRAARASELQAFEADAATKVAALKAQITAIERARDEQVATTKQGNDAEAGALTAFQARVAPETARLRDLRDFLAPAKPTAGKK